MTASPLHPPRLALLALLLLASSAAGAASSPLEVVPNTVNIFRDTRGANDLGITAGDRVQLGADIKGGSAGVSMGFLYAPTGFSGAQFGCSPLIVNPNFCSRAPAYSPDRLQPWTLNFVNGNDTLSVNTPSLIGAEQKVPFPVSVSITGGGTTPTVSWVVPGNFTPNAFRINIFDKSLFSNGQVDIIHSVAINANSLSYALPSVLSSGRSLLQGGNYSINLQLIDTRNDNQPFTNNNAEILRRSNSYFSFTPLDNDDPPNVHLPTVQDGVYNFQVEQVGPNSVTFIDPVVAIGYDYATGAGDPNFLSLLLPNVGDGSFELDYDTATGHQHVSNLAHGARFFFGEGGVRAFRVTGIEASAMLDPNNVTAFITGLTFASNGSFTGTMTPLTINVVPEPETYALMALGLLAVGWAARRRQGRLG